MFEIRPRNPGLLAGLDIIFWWWKPDEMLISSRGLGVRGSK